MTRINKELLKGSSDVFVLAVLRDEPLYGYEIARRIKKHSQDVFDMGEGTLYPILHKLEQAGLLTAFWEESTGRKRKYYSLTNAGKKMLKSKIAEWDAFSSAASNVMNA